jgi:hypothetical protein
MSHLKAFSSAFSRMINLRRKGLALLGSKPASHPSSRYSAPTGMLEALEPRQMLTAAPLPYSDNFLVNTAYTTGNQNVPSIAYAPDGSFIAVWSGEGENDDSDGVFAQRYSSTGSVIGNLIHVNTYTTSNQFLADVGFAGDGSFVITWNGQGSSDDYGIYAQIYDSIGAPIGDNFLVNTYTADPQFNPEIGVAPDGSFVITWMGPGDLDDLGIYAQQFSSKGVAIGSNFLVNSDTVGVVSYQDIDFAADGSFIIGWTQEETGTSHLGAFVQRYDSAAAPIKGNIQVSDSTRDSPYFLALGVASDGSFVVTWTGVGKDSFGQSAVFARQFDNSAAPIAPSFLVGFAADAAPDIAVVADGSYVITWETQPTPSDRDVVAQAFDSAGSTRSDLLPVASYTTSSQSGPKVASSYDGSFVITWYGSGANDDNLGVFAQLYTFNPAAAPIVDFTATDPTAVLEDSGAVTLPGWASFDPRLVRSATFTVVVTSGAGILESTPTINNKGDLSYTPAANEFGDVTFTVSISDGVDTSATQTFTLSVTSVNDVPSFTATESTTVDGNTGPQSLTGWAVADLGPANEAQTADYETLVIFGDGLLDGGISIDSSGALNFTPATDASGEVLFQARLSDGIDTTDWQYFFLTITDKTGPTVVNIVSGDSIDYLDSISVTFSKVLDETSFDWSDITLTLDGGSNLINSGTGLSITLDSGTTYTISGLSGVTNYVGSYYLTLLDASVTDNLGNALSGEASTSFKIGTVEASQPVIAGGLEGVAGFVKTTTPNVTGTATPGATVDLYEGSTKVGSGVADATGNYDVTLTLANGAHNIHAIASSPSNTATQSSDLSITVDTLTPTNANMSVFTAERTLVLDTVSVRFSTDIDVTTFDFNDVVLTRNAGPNLATAGITIAYHPGALNPHTYIISIPTALVSAIGSYSLTVNGAGILNQAHNAVSNNRSSTWTLVAAAPSAPVLDASSQISPGSTRTASATPTVKGTGSVGSTVHIFEGATLLTSTTVGADGKYSVVLPTLADGAHILKALALEGAGSAPTGFSANSTITVETFTTTIANMSSYSAPRTLPVAQTGIRFTSAIDLATLSEADFTLTRDGAPVSLTGMSILETNPATHNYTITLPLGSNTPPGVYVLTATGSGILNLDGKPVGNNLSTTWSISPSINNISQYTAPRSVIPVTEVGVRFTSTLNLATFTFADLSLTRDSVSVDISSVTITAAIGDPTKYIINIAEAISSVPGSYSLTVTGSGIQSNVALTVSNNITTTWVQE